MQTFLWDSPWGHFVPLPPSFVEPSLAHPKAGAWGIVRRVGYHCLVLASERGGFAAAVIRAKDREAATAILRSLPEWQKRNRGR